MLVGAEVYRQSLSWVPTSMEFSFQWEILKCTVCAQDNLKSTPRLYPKLGPTSGGWAGAVESEYAAATEDSEGWGLPGGPPAYHLALGRAGSSLWWLVLAAFHAQATCLYISDDTEASLPASILWGLGISQREAQPAPAE